MEIIDYFWVTLAALAAGLTNALAGGGTLFTFPTLTAVGLPAVTANITSTVALFPGYFGATMAQSKDLRDQVRRLWLFVPTGALGGLAGGILLLNTGEKVFRELVPFLILLASLLLALQNPLRAWLTRRSQAGRSAQHAEIWAVPLVFLAAIYGGYFGAGLSVIVLAVLGLTLDDSLTRLNGLKQAIAFGTNIAAASLFVFSGQVVWSAALVMMVGALLGGVLGGRLAGRIQPNLLRKIVVTVGFVVAVIYFIK